MQLEQVAGAAGGDGLAVGGEVHGGVDQAARVDADPQQAVVEDVSAVGRSARVVRPDTSAGRAPPAGTPRGCAGPR